MRRRVCFHEADLFCVLAVVNELRLAELAAVADGGDKAQHGVGADKVCGLADARPAQLRVAYKFLGIAAGGSGNDVQTLAVQKAVFLHILHHGVLPQHHRDLGKGHVAGVGEGLFKGLGVVCAGAFDGYPRDLIHALAIECAVVNVGNIFDGRRGGDKLEHGAGGEACRQAAIDIGPLRGLRFRVQRVDGRAGDHA